MRLNSSSKVCLCPSSSTNMYLHRPIFVVCCFGWGYWGFFVVFFVDVNVQGKHDGAAVAVGDGIVTLSTQDVIVVFILASEEDGSVWVRGVSCGLTGVRAASSTLFFSCRTYTLNRKLSAHCSATIFQNGGSACAVFAESSWWWSWKVGLCLFHISKSGRGVECVAIEARASLTSTMVIIGGGVINVVVVAVCNGRGEVGGGLCDGIPGSAVFGSVEVPVSSEGRAGGHGADTSG
jgi:hypothetical protein